ncbi:MAG: HDOD domain-containing protein, partial [Phycisphaerae bacterium]|nr:HDOD domain-containing protein [Phycisphaerae bacterium]
MGDMGDKPQWSSDSDRGDANQVEMLVSQVAMLPVPTLLAKWLAVAFDGRANVREWAAILASDPAVTSRLMSAVGNGDDGVSSVSSESPIAQLIAAQGCDAVGAWLIGTQVFEQFKSNGKLAANKRLDRAAWWRHSLAVGCAARLIAICAEQRVFTGIHAIYGTSIRPERAFIGGLLHDWGQLTLDALFPKSYERVIDRIEMQRLDCTEAERQIFGTDHAAAGYYLAEHWNLPAALIDAIWLHHHTPTATPIRIKQAKLALIVQLAERLVEQARLDQGNDDTTADASVPSQLVANDDRLNEWQSALGISSQAIEQIKREWPTAAELSAAWLNFENIVPIESSGDDLARTNAELMRANAELRAANRAFQQRSRLLDAVLELEACTSATLTGTFTHEILAGKMAEVVGRLTGATAVGVVVGSSARKIAVLATSSLAASSFVTSSQDRNSSYSSQIELLPAAVLNELAAVPGYCCAFDEGHNEAASRVSAERVLPAAILDRLAERWPSQPLCCWPINGRTGWIFAIGSVANELDASILVLGRTAHLLLAQAESQAAARQLSHEFAEMNRRLIDAQAQAARTRSLAMVSEMAAGAAHELNNPLAVISGRAQMLARDAANHSTSTPANISMNASIKRSADIIAEHAQRASNIVIELMDFAKPTPPKPTRWSLAEMLRSLRQEWIARHGFRPEQFELRLSDGPLETIADAAQIRLLLDEVIRNAVAAMPNVDTRRLSINCRNDVADDWLVIQVEDNGIGMPSDILERAFDPFFSHRSAGRGRGLG